MLINNIRRIILTLKAYILNIRTREVILWALAE